MSQITIYVPDDEARAIRQAARMNKRSLSEWARERLTSGLRQDWPDGYHALLGSLRDDTLVRPAQGDQIRDVRRERV